MKEINIVSLGAGVQSTVMALMAARGEIEPFPDAMIFADTQFEPQGIYEHLNWIEGEVTRMTNGRLPLYRVTAGSIKDDHLNGMNTTGQRFASMPLFTEGGGMGRRQCTQEYKIAPIRKQIRALLGVDFGKRVPKGTKAVSWIGISVDEAVRMKPSRDKWCENRWPLIEKRMSRGDCKAWFNRAYPGRTLSKSACIVCPFKNNTEWRALKNGDPESWRQAVEFDAAVRSSGTSEQQFAHRSLKPLSEVDLSTPEDHGQGTLWGNECEGMCGI
jgi:hypothetical protein